MAHLSDDVKPDRTAPLVIKIGGALSTIASAAVAVGQAVGRLAARRRVIVIPGGGPFARAVRDYDQVHALSPSAAHWMAILAMDQYAWALAERIPESVVVEDHGGIAAAHRAHEVPILAPYRWLRAADELPHSWDVTSDSLAAYLTTLLGAGELLLVKPVPGGRELCDPWFERAVPAGLPWRVVGWEELLEDEAGGRLGG